MDRLTRGRFRVVNVRTDTLEVNVKVPLGKHQEANGLHRMPDDLETLLEDYQKQAKEVEQDVATQWTFLGQTLFCLPFGAGHGWRWILHSPDVHLHLGRGKLNEHIAYARFSSLLLHAMDEGDLFSAFYRFLASFIGHDRFVLQTREVHRCVDVMGWELHKADQERFVTRGAFHNRPEEELVFLPEVQGRGRRLRQFDFSKTGHHSCCIYDKTREVKISGKEWLYEVWKQNGWDGQTKVTRTEFRYDRTCCREMGIDDPYEMLDRFDSMWAYSTQKWLRHTRPSLDRNQSRWDTSDVWQLIQSAPLSKPDPVPAVREKKIEADARRALAGFVGYGVSLAVRSKLPLRVVDDGGGFMEWAYGQMQDYLNDRKGATFQEMMHDRALHLGLSLSDD